MSDDLERRFATMSKEMEATRAMFRRTMVVVAGMAGDIKEIRAFIRNEAVTKDEMHRHMNGFARMFQEAQLEWGKLALKVNDHEKRLKDLENPGV